LLPSSHSSPGSTDASPHTPAPEVTDVPLGVTVVVTIPDVSPVVSPSLATPLDGAPVDDSVSP
jgi:hypothetical protein